MKSLRAIVAGAIAAAMNPSQPTWHGETAPRVPTGGHRAKGYKRTQADTIRVEAAYQKRERRALKRARDYARCIANNPCLA